jgi:hypothetical protein
MTKIAFHRIGEDDIPRMAAMEVAAWGSLGAEEATIRNRLSLGHTMIAAVHDTVIAGAVCFVETSQDPRDKATFPATFTAYSSLARSSAKVSLCLQPGRSPGVSGHNPLSTAIGTSC